MSYRQMVRRNVIRSLINSPFYFDLPAAERLALVKQLAGA